MRAHRLALAFLVAAAMGQIVPLPTITVIDENGVAVPSARVSLRPSSGPAIRSETDFHGRFQLPTLQAGSYQLHIEKTGFYSLEQQNVEISRTSNLEVVISHQREVRETVDVHESAPAIDPAQISSQESLSGLDVVNMIFPTSHDYRNAINFIPGAVQDQSGQPHIAGAQTYQTVTLLDGFNVTQPANGQLLVRVSTDSFRSIQIEPSREPAEAGKGSGGLLDLNTGVGDDHFRFYATNFIPSVQDKHGWRFDQFLPLFTFSGPIIKRKIWFYDAFDGEYDNTIYTALPVGADNDHTIRLGNLTKVQSNLNSRNILTTSFLFNHLHDQYAFLSPQSPQQANPKDDESAHIASIRDQHYFAGGQLLETGVAFNQYDTQLTPYGAIPYFVNVETAGGNFYLNQGSQARRWQAIANLYLPAHHWHGSHDFKVGTDLDRIFYTAHFARQPIAFLNDSNTLTSPGLCQTASLDANFPCTRYSTFTPGLRHDQFNGEISAYAEDRWSITNRLLIEPGIRLDWDQIVRHAEIAPRLAGTYVLDNSGNTKLSAGIGIIYESTPIFLIARPFAGTREDTFYSIPDPTCLANCVVTTGPVTTTFTANTSALQAPRFVNWSIGLEKKLPAAIYLKAEFFERRGTRGFVYDTHNHTISGNFVLENSRDDRYDAFQISARRSFREAFVISGAYTRSRARSNQALDFNIDNPILSIQQPGPYPWDTPNRFLSWGYLPFLRLPILHQTEIAYSMEARTGFPFSLLSPQQQLISAPGAERFPDYFALNVQLEKRFHFLGYYLAVRGGFDNITGRCDPFVVNNIIDPATHTAPTFAACTGRAFTSRIRLLGRK
ncbi:MAG TPA: carboxypeptidase regulatory-like domain-containing protein [Candidatus Sulfotelmatobacter sp.]|nr:carboxypeptidase regulatory-like domain-containing protein [Candidatus Sulfotelmatobacter sp.]